MKTNKNLSNYIDYNYYFDEKGNAFYMFENLGGFFKVENIEDLEVI